MIGLLLVEEVISQLRLQCTHCHYAAEEPRARATVEAAMDWHHGNIRPGSAPVVWHHVLAPLRKQNGNDPIAKHAEGVLLQSLEVRRMTSMNALQNLAYPS